MSRNPRDIPLGTLPDSRLTKSAVVPSPDILPARSSETEPDILLAISLAIRLGRSIISRLDRSLGSRQAMSISILLDISLCMRLELSIDLLDISAGILSPLPLASSILDMFDTSPTVDDSEGGRVPIEESILEVEGMSADPIASLDVSVELTLGGMRRLSSESARGMNSLDLLSLLVRRRGGGSMGNPAGFLRAISMDIRLGDASAEMAAGVLGESGSWIFLTK